MLYERSINSILVSVFWNWINVVSIYWFNYGFVSTIGMRHWVWRDFFGVCVEHTVSKLNVPLLIKHKPGKNEFLIMPILTAKIQDSLQLPDNFAIFCRFLTLLNFVVSKNCQVNRFKKSPFTSIAISHSNQIIRSHLVSVQGTFRTKKRFTWISERSSITKYTKRGNFQQLSRNLPWKYLIF